MSAGDQDYSTGMRGGLPTGSTALAIEIAELATKYAAAQQRVAELETELSAMRDAFSAATERADSAWANTRIADKARQEEMRKRDTAESESAALREQVAARNETIEILECNMTNDSIAYGLLLEHCKAKDAEVAALREDAERYRWLRACGMEFDNLSILDGRGALVPEALDAAIDNARKGDKHGVS